MTIPITAYRDLIAYRLTDDAGDPTEFFRRMRSHGTSFDEVLMEALDQLICAAIEIERVRYFTRRSRTAFGLTVDLEIAYEIVEEEVPNARWLPELRWVGSWVGPWRARFCPVIVLSTPI